MSRSAAKQFFFKNLYIVIIALTGFIFILMLANYGGIGLSPDSITYTSVAKSLAQNGSFHQYDDAPFVDFPAGYPLFLSIIFKISGSDYVHTGMYINAILFAALLFICGLVLQRFTHMPVTYKIAALICIVFNPGLQEVYSMLWSETLFIMLSVLFMIALYEYMQTGNVKNLLFAALVVSIMCIVRYAGIAFIAAGGFIILFMKHISVKQKIIHLLLFASLAVSLLTCNLIRNYLVEGFATGEREKSITPLLSNIYYFGTVLFNWFSLQSTNRLIVILFAIIFIILLIAAVAWHFLTKKNNATPGYISAVFALIYILFIIIAASVSRFERIDSRLITPAFIPLIFTLVYWLNKFAAATRGSMKFICISINIVIAVLLISAEFNNSYASYSDIKDYGIPGYTDDDWRLSQTVQFIQAHSKDFGATDIYSNANDAVYFFTQKHAQQLPHKESPEEIKELIDEDTFYIVWFSFTDNDDDVSLKYILQNKPMKIIHQFKDGVVYVTTHNTANNSH